MAVLRPHLALVVRDVDRSVAFYEALLGVAPDKRRPGYARFSVASPALNLALNEGVPTGSGALDHAGVQVAGTHEVLAARERLVAAGLATFAEMDATCCYARQDKIWVRDPDGTPWEIFVTHADTEEAGTSDLPLAGCGCGDSGCACAAVGAANACCV